MPPEITFAGEIVATAELPAYASLLAGEGIDAAFPTDLKAKMTEASALVANAGGKTSSKETTLTEAERKQVVLDLIIVSTGRNIHDRRGVPDRSSIGFPLRT